MTKDTPILTAERVVLRPLTGEDVPLLVRWLFDPEVLHWLQLSEDPPALRTAAAMQERYERMAADPRTRVWRIDTSEGEPIGQIELVDIHGLQQRAEMHLAIGEKATWSGGYGTAAIRRVLQYAFSDLGLRRVFVIADEDNVRAQGAFAKAGFVHEGTLRAHRLRHGEPVNMVIMGVLREESERLEDRARGQSKRKRTEREQEERPQGPAPDQEQNIRQIGKLASKRS